MDYTRTTQRSWGERMGGSFRGMLTGVVLVAAGTTLLFWNEGRTVKTGGAIDEARMVTVTADDISKNDPALNDKVVYATGRANTEDTVVDPIFGVSANAIKITRKVMYYQWVEESHEEKRKKVGGGEETVTTYTYRKEWVHAPVDSSSFADPKFREQESGFNILRTSEPYANVVLGHFDDETFTAPNVSFGAYWLPDFLKNTIGGDEPLEVRPTDEDIAAIRDHLQLPNGRGGLFGSSLKEKDLVHPSANTLYIGANPGAPHVGDVRVTFTTTPPADVSVIAQVTGSTFKKFTASNGYTFSRLSMGTKSMEEMFAGAKSDNTIIAVGLRILGTMLVIFGLRNIFRPLSVIADVLPILGSIVGMGTNLVATLLGLAWSLLVIAVAWVRFRPLLAGALSAVALALTGFLYMKGRKKTSIAP